MPCKFIRLEPHRLRKMLDLHVEASMRVAPSPHDLSEVLQPALQAIGMTESF
jgi:hypothetical protein